MPVEEKITCPACKLPYIDPESGTWRLCKRCPYRIPPEIETQPVTSGDIEWNETDRKINEKEVGPLVLISLRDLTQIRDERDAAIRECAEARFKTINLKRKYG